METFEAIKGRRSIRKYTDAPVSAEDIDRLLEAARWAPSGLNNQPWRFMKITDDDLIGRMSELTKYRGVVSGSKALIAVFLDSADMYDRTKDLQSSGAAIQNMLLAAHDIGLGACWLGEILSHSEDVEKLLGVPDDYEFVALVALGHPVPETDVGVRHPLEKLVIPQPL